MSTPKDPNVRARGLLERREAILKNHPDPANEVDVEEHMTALDMSTHDLMQQRPLCDKTHQGLIDSSLASKNSAYTDLASYGSS